MAMVLTMTIKAPWNGRDFAGADAARKVMAEAKAKVEAAMNGSVSYEESVRNERAGKGDPE